MDNASGKNAKMRPLPADTLDLLVVFCILWGMLIIRFQRVGRRNDPAYRIVVAEKRSKPHGIGVEIVGSYHPKTKHTVLASDRILHWMAKGAQPSATVHNLLVKKGVTKGSKRHVAKTPAPAQESAAAAA